MCANADVRKNVHVAVGNESHVNECFVDVEFHRIEYSSSFQVVAEPFVDQLRRLDRVLLLARQDP